MENPIDENLITGDVTDKGEQSQGEAGNIDKENINLSSYLDKEILDLFHPTARKILDDKGKLAGVRAEITCPDPECGQVKVIEDYLADGKFDIRFPRKHLKLSQRDNWYIEEEKEPTHSTGNLNIWVSNFCQYLKDYAPVYLNPDINENLKTKFKPICPACRVRNI